jgi:phage tail-like protein
MAQTGVPPDPLRTYAFKLYVGNIAEGHFTECSSLNVSVAVITYNEGGNTPTTYKLPGPVTYGNITLKYGLTTSTEMWDWFMAAVNGRIDYRNVSVAMLDTTGAEQFRWNLNYAWISGWTGAPLAASGQTIAVETVTLVYQYLERA